MEHHESKENHEIFIKYITYFSLKEISEQNEDLEPKSINKYKKRHDWT